MRWLDLIIPQNIERVRDNDRCAETSARDDENGRRSEYYDHRDGRNNTQDQH